MIGTQIGGYRVIELLAEGGMGAVYVARHELMQREAVIKVLLPALSADQEMVRRFLNEARAATQIHHPGIVEIFDMGFLPSGQAYIAMERLRGQPLSARLRDGVLSASQAIALARQLAGALGAAHEVGIVHRDLKPDNLFLCRDPSVKDPIVPGGERLKILDFGIAKLAHSGGAVATRAGAVFGTPAYMSPEQCTSAGDVDQRADLYAVGCILFEALCGRPPFGHGGIELIAAHMRDQPPDPRTLGAAAPPALTELLFRLLEKAPARRPQSCAEMLAALEQPARSNDMLAPTLTPHGSGHVAVQSPAPPLPTPSAAGERHAPAASVRRGKALPIALAGIVVVGGAAVAAVALGGGPGAPAEVAGRTALAAEPAVTTPPPAIDAAPAPIAPEALPPETVPDPAPTAAPKPVRPPRAEPPPKPDKDARELLAAGRAHMAKMEWEAAIASFEQVIARKQYAGAAYLGIANARYQTKDLAAAIEAAERALKAGAGDDARLLLGHAHYKLGDHDRARAQYQQVLTRQPNHREARAALSALDRRAPPASKEAAPPAPAPATAGETRSRSDIMAGITPVKGRVAACAQQYAASGTAKVRLNIDTDGKVTSAEVQGELAGTPAGACVEAAVKAARFAPSQESSSVTYPFLLR